ncbi:MAG: hypothetical protein ABW065_08545 [Solirubrobacterales bacterium]
MTVGLVWLATVEAALAAPGYELDPGKPSISTSSEVPRGIAIDQASQMLYVAELVKSRTSGGAGQIEQFTSSGIPTANSPFSTGTGADFFAGLAVNPVNQGIYAYQVELNVGISTLGTAVMNTFSSTGALGTSFTPPKSTAPQLAADASGKVYLPNDSTASVQVFTSAGTLTESIPCTGCPGGPFVEPVSVALDSAGNLYAVDLASGGRVLKFKQSAGKYVYNSVLQTGRGAVAVGVDPSDNTVFVGDLSSEYHIVAYNSSGTQIDDFGGGILALPSKATAAGQIAASSTTHSVYVADSASNKVWIFDRVASIPPPAATTDPADPVGQLDADLNSTVNPLGHALTSCKFEYSEDTDYQLHGFANAITAPCSLLPGGSQPVSVSAHLSGLTPSTKYDFRVTAASNGGSDEGVVREFTTLPALPPEATTGAAVSVTQTTAKLAGIVNPRGGLVSNCRFELVTKAGFDATGFSGAKSAQCSPKTPSGTTGIAVTASFLGLTAGTDYRFRVVVTTNAGTVAAPAGNLTTLADTCATKPALCPPPVEEPKPTPTPSPEPTPATPPAPTPTPTPPVVKKPVKCRKGFAKKRVRGKLKCVKVKRHRK